MTLALERRTDVEFRRFVSRSHRKVSTPLGSEFRTAPGVHVVRETRMFYFGPNVPRQKSLIFASNAPDVGWVFDQSSRDQLRHRRVSQRSALHSKHPAEYGYVVRHVIAHDVETEITRDPFTAKSSRGPRRLSASLTMATLTLGS